MKDIVLITGANGHLAKVVTKNLRKNYEVRNLTTNKKMSNKKTYFLLGCYKRLYRLQGS